MRYVITCTNPQCGRWTNTDAVDFRDCPKCLGTGDVPGDFAPMGVFEKCRECCGGGRVRVSHETCARCGSPMRVGR